MKIKVVVIDDDFSALKAIKNYCEQLDLDVIDAFNSSSKFFEEMDHLDFDIAILDYEMPQYNGLQLAELLNSKNIPVIFVTGHRDLIAAKAWDINCIDCIEKPVSIEKLKRSLSKFKPNIRINEYLELELYGGSLTKIKITDIVHIGGCKDDSSHNDKTLILNSGKEYRIVNKKLEEFMRLLPSEMFMRISKSDIVSKNSIDSWSKNFEELVLNVDSKKVYVSPKRKEEFIVWFRS